MEFSTKHFLNELLSVEINIKDGNFIAQSKDLFNISHMIITNKEKYKNNINYEKIELFYHIFFLVNFQMKMKLMILHFFINYQMIIQIQKKLNYIYLILVLLF